MEALYRLKDLLCDQVEEIVAKNDITPTELDRVYKVVDVIKDITTIDAMVNVDFEDFDEDMMSYRGSYEGGNSGRRGGYSRAGRSYRGSYDGGYSGRRGYSRAGRGGGSGNSYRMSYDDAEMSKDHLMQKVAEMQRQIEQM